MITYERDKKVILGYVPIKRDTFPSGPAAVLRDKIRERIDGIVSRLEDVELVCIDEIIEGGMLWDHRDVDKVVRYLQERNVDAVFYPHCNFGQENVVAMTAKKLDKPVLLWGPRDPDPGEDKSGKTGPRDYDTQCGLLATSRALKRYGVPFTYIENCWLESDILDKEFEKFIRVASVVKAFRGMRVGQLGARPRQFLTVEINESELQSKFGIEIVPIWPEEVQTMAEKLLRGIDPSPTGSEINFRGGADWGPVDPAKKDPRILQIAEEIKAEVGVQEITDEKLEKIALFVLSVMELAKINRLDAIAVDCWSFTRQAFGIASCFGLAELFDRGLPAACETDIHAAIGAVLLQAAGRYQSPAFVADVTIRHPQNDNAELLWHCGPFAKSLRKKDANAFIRDEKGMYEIEGGPLTVVRFDQDNGEYKLFADEGVGTDGPATTGNYVWFETKDWVKWEKKLIYGPYIHHVTGMHGHYADILKEACKYMGPIEHDSVEEICY